MEDVIKDFLKKGFIRQSQSPYGAPVIPVLKKNGQIRLCIDYCRLNKKTIPRQYPILRTDDLLEKMKGSQYFTVLDLTNGYFQIPKKEWRLFS